jgi:ABC-type transport system involved in multi-copper enzyme maturation permease subunit
MQHLLRSELFRSRKRAQTWILFAIVLGIDLLFYGGFIIAHFARPDSQNIIDTLKLENIYDNGIAVVSLIGSIVAVVFGSSLIGSEFGWNTLRPVLARARTRSTLLTAKWLTVAIFTVALAAVAVLLTMVSAAVGSTLAGEGAGVAAGTLIDFVAVTLRLALGILPYAALAMCIALVMRSNAAGIAIGIALAFAEPILFALFGSLTDVFKTIEKGGISWNTNRILTYAGDNDITLSNVWTSIGVIAIWVALFAAVSYWIFNRRDVTSG